MFNSSYTQRAREIQSERADEDTLQLGTDMDIKDPLI
jgi:hypothetical protein